MVYDSREREMLRRSGLSDKAIDDDEARLKSMSKMNRMNQREVSDEEVQRMRDHQQRLHEVATKTAPDSYKDRDKNWYYTRSDGYQEEEKFKADQAAYKKKDDADREFIKTYEKNKSKIENFGNLYNKKALAEKFRGKRIEEKARIEKEQLEKDTDPYKYERKRLADLAAKRRRYDNESGTATFPPAGPKKKWVPFDFSDDDDEPTPEPKSQPTQNNGTKKKWDITGGGKPALPKIKGVFDTTKVKLTGRLGGKSYSDRAKEFDEGFTNNYVPDVMYRKRVSEFNLLNGNGDDGDTVEYAKYKLKVAADKITRAKERISKIMEDRNKFDDLDRERLKVELAKVGVDMREPNNVREINKINSKKDLKDYLKSLKTAGRIMDKTNQHGANEDIVEEIGNSAYIGMEKYNRDMLVSPTKTKLKMGILGISEEATQNIVSQKIKSIFDGFNDKDYLENGASPEDITQLRLLEDRYNAAKYANDTGLQNQLGREIVLTKGKINRAVLTSKRADASERAKLRTEELENRKLEKQIEGMGGSSFDTSTPKAKTELRDLKFVTNLRDIETASYGSPIGISPGFSGYGNPVNLRKDYNIDFARKRIGDKRMRKLNEFEMARMEAARRDAKLQSAFNGTDRIVAMVNGNYAPSQSRLSNLPSVGAVRKNKNVRPIAKMNQLQIAMPNVNLNLTRGVSLPKKHKAVVNNPLKNNQINVSSRIAAGIENMVAPHRSMAAAHKDRFYHNPTCAIADICGNVRSTATAHKSHVAEFKNINIGIGSLVGGRTFGIGKPAVKKPSTKSGFGVIDIKIPNIAMPGKKKVRK